jgi:hypothetical protein
MTTTTTTSPSGPNSAKSKTPKVVLILSLVVGLVGAAVPAITTMDFSSSAGILAGLVAVSAVIVKYLDGWQKYEARLDAQPADGGDAPAEAEPEQDAAATDEVEPEDSLAQVTTIAPPRLTIPASDPTGSPAAALQVVDHEEPDAPVPGQFDTSLELVPGEEVADVPGPPTDDEIAAVAAELAGGQSAARLVA